MKVKKRWIALGAVVVVLGGGYAFARTKKPAQRPPSAETIEATEARLARGKYLVEHVVVCMDCHSERDWGRYGAPAKGVPGSGGDCMGEDVGAPGKICVSNISSSKEHGIGAWTDGEILRAVREGVDREGNALFPMMPYPFYRSLSDEDARAVVAFVRTLPASEKKVEDSHIDFPVSFFISMVPEPLEGPVPEPDTSTPEKKGKYLATISGCISCHTPVDDKHVAIPGKELAGGQEFTGPWGKVRSVNLTPHDKTGIGTWTKERFVSRFKANSDTEVAAVKIDPSSNTVMPWLGYAGMSEEDLGAIYAFLKSVPAVENEVERRPK